MQTQTHAETAVQGRYSLAAQAQEAELCCPVDYDPQYLDAIPAEVPLRHPRETKGMEYDATTDEQACCLTGSCES